MKLLLLLLIPVILFAQGTTANTLLLLRPDKGITLVGNKVSVWADQSGNSNDFTQSADANRPTYTDSEPVLDGVDDFMLGGTSLGDFGTGDFTITVRYKHTTLTTYNDLISKGSNAVVYQWILGFWTDGSSPQVIYNNTYLIDPTTILNTVYYVTTIVRTGNKGILYLDGTNVIEDATYFASADYSNTVAITIGGRYAGTSHWFDGIITDVRIDEAALTQAQIQTYIDWIDAGRPAESTSRGYGGYGGYGGW